MIPLLLIRIGFSAEVFPGKVTVSDSLAFRATSTDESASSVTVEDEAVGRVTTIDDP